MPREYAHLGSGYPTGTTDVTGLDLAGLRSSWSLPCLILRKKGEVSMSSSDESRARQLRSDISGLQRDLAKEADRAATASAAAARAREQAAKATSESTARSRLREAERRDRENVDAQKRQAGIHKKIAAKTKDLQRSDQRIADEQSKAAKRQARATKTLQEELERRGRDQRSQVAGSLSAMRGIDATTARSAAVPREFDFFVSYATPDKPTVAGPLAEALKRRGAEVFWDEWEIRVGDSLRKRIDEGLARSRYGVVVLSEAFLSGRTWTERELNGLFALEEDGEPRILPIWHQVTKGEVAKYSPVLSDRAALKTADYTIDEIADLLVERLGVGGG